MFELPLNASKPGKFQDTSSGNELLVDWPSSIGSKMSVLSKHNFLSCFIPANRHQDSLSSSQDCNVASSEASESRLGQPEETASLEEENNKSDSLDQGKKKRRVQFSQTSKLRQYHQDHENKEQLFLSKKDRLKIKRRNSIIAVAIRETIKDYSAERCYDSPGFVMEEEEIVVALNSCNNKYGIESEELIGLEHFVHGREFAQSLDLRRKLIIQTVVKEWHEKKGKGDSECVIKESVAKLSRRLSKRSALKARRRAEYTLSLSNSSAVTRLPSSVAAITFDNFIKRNSLVCTSIESADRSKANAQDYSSWSNSIYYNNDMASIIESQKERRQKVQMYNKSIISRSA